MELSVTWDVKTLTNTLSKFEKKQVPFATANAINDTAADVRTALYRKMNAVFSAPTAFTVPRNIEKATNRKGSLFLVPAKKNKLSAMVHVKDYSYSGAPAIKWLRPHIKGGGRGSKASERSLRIHGIIGGDKDITPSTRSPYGSVSLNKFGNVTKGMMVKILSGLSALQGAPSGNVSRQSSSYFILRLGGKGSATGIWKRTGKNRIQKLFNVTNQPKYKPRLPFDSVGRDSFNKNFKPNFERQIQYAIRTAR